MERISRVGGEDADLITKLYADLRRFAAVVAPWDIDPDDVLHAVLVTVMRRGRPSDLDDPGAYLRRSIVNRVRSLIRTQSARRLIQRRLTGGGPFFLAKTNDAVRQTFWLSEDGVSWAPLDVPAGVRDVAFVPGEDGLLWWGDSAKGSVDVGFTPDGENWSTGSIPPPESPLGWDWLVLAIEQIGGRWVAIGESFDGDALSVGQVWTSDDGLSWTWQGSELGFLPATWMVSATDGVLAITANTSADPSTLESREVWATNDGVSWQKVLEADRDIWFFSVGTDANGELVGVWMPRPVPEGEFGPETTMTG